MIGLPGATPASFRDDLQDCIDREVTAKIYPTELLVNSPMNEPGYRDEHRIETSAPLGSLVRTSRNRRRLDEARAGRVDRELHPRRLRRDARSCDACSSSARTSACCARSRGSCARRRAYARSTSTNGSGSMPAPDPTGGRRSRSRSRSSRSSACRPVSWQLFIDEVRALPHDAARHGRRRRPRHRPARAARAAADARPELPHRARPPARLRGLASSHGRRQGRGLHRLGGSRARTSATCHRPSSTSTTRTTSAAARSASRSTRTCTARGSSRSSVARAVSHEHLWDAEAV